MAASPCPMMDPMIVDSDDAADSEADDNHVRRMIQINVTSLDGDSFWLSVLPWNTIRDVNQEIALHHRIPIVLQGLAFQEVPLELDHTLDWYNIQNSAILTLIKLPIQVSFDQAKIAFRNIGLRQVEDRYRYQFPVDDPSEVALSDLEESPYKCLRIVSKFFEGGEVVFEEAKFFFEEAKFVFQFEENEYAHDWLDGCSTRPHEIGIAFLRECPYKYYRIIGRFFEERIG